MTKPATIAYGLLLFGVTALAFVEWHAYYEQRKAKMRTTAG